MVLNNKKTSFPPKRNKVPRNVHKVGSKSNGQHIPNVMEGQKFGKTRNATQKSNGKQVPIHEPEEHKLEFVFLGKGHKQPNLFDDSDEEDIDPMVGFKMPPFLMHGLFGGPRLGREDAADDYCTEIVDQLRQNNNSLIQELKEMRKEVKECSEESNKQMIGAIKELQTELKKTFVEELPKLNNK